MTRMYGMELEKSTADLTDDELRRHKRRYRGVIKRRTATIEELRYELSRANRCEQLISMEIERRKQEKKNG